MRDFFSENAPGWFVTSEQDCIEALQEAAAELDESPTKAQYEALGLTPSASTVLRHCGGWNAAKERAGLETNASTGSRAESKPDDVTLPKDTEWAALTQDQRWHYRNREWNTHRTLERRRNLRRWIHAWKAASSGCTRCDETNPGCLEFHHPDEADKEMAVNSMVPYGYSKADIRAEIEKCKLLCANCHWTEHNSEPPALDTIPTTDNNSESDATPITAANIPDSEATRFTRTECLRAWTYAYKQDRGCRRCGEADPVCLQFHHAEEKSMGVGAMIANSYPTAAVLSEVENCVVLCGNCHRVEHYQNPSK